MLDWAIDLTASGTERGEIPDIRTLGKLCHWLGVGPSRQQRVNLTQLRALDPGLRQLRTPAAHTLRLDPLAITHNPYHDLVKHYQDGQLKRGRINDPELGARLALEVFNDQ